MGLSLRNECGSITGWPEIEQRIVLTQRQENKGVKVSMAGTYLYHVVLLPGPSIITLVCVHRGAADGELGRVLSSSMLVCFRPTLVSPRSYTRFQPETLASVARTTPVSNSESGHLLIPRPSPGTEDPQNTKTDDRERKNASERASDDCHWIQAGARVLLRVKR